MLNVGATRDVACSLSIISTFKSMFMQRTIPVVDMQCITFRRWMGAIKRHEEIWQRAVSLRILDQVDLAKQDVSTWRISDSLLGISTRNISS